MSKKLRLTRMIGKTGDVAFDLSNLHFSEFHPIEVWRPDINAYRYDDRIEVWVDLAGVDKASISVEILNERVRISGERQSPTPTRDASSQCRQVLHMEIESGRFSREIALPEEVERNKVSARQENGLLWIVLPIAKGDRN